ICAGLREYKMKTPVLILSVQSEIEEKVSLLNCGADDYVTKPYHWNELAARVKALLRRPAELEPNDLTIGDAFLDRDQFALILRGATYPLTAKEFMIVEYLMKNAGKVISREEVMEHVWDGN